MSQSQHTTAADAPASERSYYLVTEGECELLSLAQAAEVAWDGTTAVLVYADDEREALGLAHLYDNGNVGVDNLDIAAGGLAVLRRENVPSNAWGYVVYGETAIYGAGWTADLAIEDARQYAEGWDGGLVDHRDVNQGGLALARATAALVIAVQVRGGDLSWDWLPNSGYTGVACLPSEA